MIDIVNQARALAEHKHQFQHRKDGSPYITHPVAVGHLAREIGEFFGLDAEVLDNCMAAGYLHDCIEDCECDYEDVQKATNTTVADMVAALSDDKRLPKAQRRLAYIEQLLAADLPTQIVKLADVLDNSDSLRRGQHVLSPAFQRDWLKEAKLAVASVNKVADCPHMSRCLDNLSFVEATLATAN